MPVQLPLYTYRIAREPIADPVAIRLLKEMSKRGSIPYGMVFNHSLYSKAIIAETPVLSLFGADGLDFAKVTPFPYGDALTGHQLKEYYQFKTMDSQFHLNGKGDYLVAMQDGFFVIDNGNPVLIPISFDLYYELRISSDNMYCFLDLYPPKKAQLVPAIEEIHNTAFDLGVKVVIDDNKIEHAIHECVSKSAPVYDTIIATGKHPIHGRDSTIEYLVNVRESNSPKIGEDGRIDFYNLDLIKTVREGDPILKIHNAELPEDGYDVFAKVLYGNTGSQVDLPQIDNTKFSENDRTLLISKINGNISWVRGQLRISEEYNVNGDVDISIGNIETGGSLSVKGDVRTDFSLKVGHELKIGGCVEDSKIYADGSVTIRQGFAGTGKGIVVAGGDVRVKYLSYQKIYSRGSVYVENEAIDATIFAKDNIHLGGRKLTLSGGSAFAGKLVQAESLGNQYYTPTMVQVGYDYKLDEDVKVLLRELEKKAKEFEAIKELLTKSKIFPGMSREQFNRVKDANSQRIVIEKELEEVKNRLKEIERIKHTPGDAKVVVRGKIFPGTTIIINKQRFVITEEMFGKTFMLSKTEEFLIA